MNTPKTIKSLAVILLGFSAVALAGLNVRQYRQIQWATERQSLDDASADNSLAVSMAEKQMRIAGKVPSDGIVSSGNPLDGSSEAEELIYHLESAEEELAEVQEQLAEDQAQKAERQKIEEKPTDGFIKTAHPFPEKSDREYGQNMPYLLHFSSFGGRVGYFRYTFQRPFKTAGKSIHFFPQRSSELQKRMG